MQMFAPRIQRRKGKCCVQYMALDYVNAVNMLRILSLKKYYWLQKDQVSFFVSEKLFTAAVGQNRPQNRPLRVLIPPLTMSA